MWLSSQQLEAEAREEERMKVEGKTKSISLKALAAKAARAKAAKAAKAAARKKKV